MHVTVGGGPHGHSSNNDRGAAVERRALRDDRRRRRAGRAVGRLLPEEARAAVRHPGRQRADRRLLAGADLGLAASLHACSLRPPAPPALPLSRPGRSHPPTAPPPPPGLPPP